MPRGNHHLNYIPALAGLIFAAALAPQVAQAQTTELGTIFVEGTSLDFSPEPLSDVGSAVSVVTGEELERRQIRHAGDALRSLPGVSVSQSGGTGNVTQVRIRGAEGNHTLVLIDGIEVNDPTTGEFDFSDLLVENIAQIEVIRGAQSGLYGSSAIGGVINITTRDGAGPTTLVARAEAGSFDTTNFATTMSAGSDRMWGSFSLARSDTNGFNLSREGAEDDGSGVSNANLKLGVRPYSNFKIVNVLRWMRKNGDRDTFFAPIGELQVLTDNPSTFASDTFIAGSVATLDLLDDRWTHQVGANTFQNETSDTGLDTPAFPFVTSNDSKRHRFFYLTSLRAGSKAPGATSHVFTGKIEREMEFFTGRGDFADNIEHSRTLESVIGEYRGAYANRVFINAALRHDDSNVFEDFTTWQVAGALKVHRLNGKLHGSAGTGVKFPSLFEQFGSVPNPVFFTPNPNLLPEESQSWDVGWEQAFYSGRFVTDVTYFESELENEIGSNPNRAGPADPSLVNFTGVSTRKGIEVSVRGRLTDTVDVGAAYTWLDAKEPSGLIEVRRPENTARGDVNWRFSQGRGNLNFAVIYNGETEDLAFRVTGPFGAGQQERVLLDDYTLVKVAGSYEVRPGVELVGRIVNLLDEDYEEIYGIESAGLAAYGGVRVTLGGNQDDQ